LLVTALVISLNENAFNLSEVGVLDPHSRNGKKMFDLKVLKPFHFYYFQQATFFTRVLDDSALLFIIYYL
jgi:hypothetical protein